LTKRKIFVIILIENKNPRGVEIMELGLVIAILVLSVVCAVLLALTLRLGKESAKTIQLQMNVINDQDKTIDDLRCVIKELELLPCRLLYLTVYFDQDSPWQIVDLSKYDDAKIVGVTVGLERSPNEQEILADVPGRAVPIPYGAVCKIGESFLWGVA
jgi:hypothetical protein